MESADARPGGFPPQAFLVGAQKCATTFFAQALEAHPDVCVAQPKEPDFFSANQDKGLDWYRRCFANPDAGVLLDASTSYSIAPTDPVRQTPATPTWGVPERIARLCPHARILYVVRNPVDRAYAAYWHEVRSGYEDRDVRRAIAERPWYLDGSRYAFQLGRYIQMFGRDRVLVTTIEEVTRATAATCAKAWRFLGLAPVQGPSSGTPGKNVGYTYTSLGALVFQRPTVRHVTQPLALGVKRVLPLNIYRWLKNRVTRELPPMSPEERDRIWAQLADDAAAFAELTGIDYRTAVDLRARM